MDDNEKASCRRWSTGREGLSPIHLVATVVVGGPTLTRRASFIRERSPRAMIQVSRPSMLTQIQCVKLCGSTAGIGGRSPFEAATPGASEEMREPGGRTQ